MLAAVMLITFAAPVYATGFDRVQDIVDVTGGRGTTENNATTAPAPPAQPGLPPPDMGEIPLPEQEPEEEHGDVAAPATGASNPAAPGTDVFYLDATPEQAARLIAFFESVKRQIANQPAFTPFAVPGDTGTVTWSWGEAVNINVGGYFINNLPVITLSTANMPIGRPMCVQFGVDPGGSYTAGAGTNNQVLRLLVALHNGTASPAGVQLALWHVAEGLPFHTHPQAAAALAAASGVNTSGFAYLHWSSGTGQDFVTLVRDDDPGDPGDPGGPCDPPDEECPGYRIEVETVTETRTEVRSNTTFEYSDAIGQITVSKRDHQGNSLDGAIFSIEVEFANGERAGTSAFEVYNGSRLFTWTHPANDHRPARVTVTEVTPPYGFSHDPAPQTAWVHPTYTRITKVTTHTITITTTHVTSTVIDIDSGAVLSSSTASDSSQTELNPPVVQEYADFVAGDRNVTLTFANEPLSMSLTLYKYSKGDLTQALEGARFRIRYANPDVSAHVWYRTTDGTGRIVIDPLPSHGTLIIEELEAPPGHVIGDVSSWTVTVARGEQKRVDISNNPKPSVTLHKLCGVTRNPLQATFEIRVQNGRSLGMFTTDPITGKVVIENLDMTGDPLVLEITERIAPSGYHLSAETKVVSLSWGEHRIIEWQNTPQNPIIIYKRDVDGNPIGDTEFLVTTVNGAHVALVRTDRTTGVAVVPGLEFGWYFVRETRVGSEEFILDSTPKLVELRPNGNPAIVEFINDRHPQLQIRKQSSADNSPMQGVLIRVNRMSGEHVGDFRTDAQGLITLQAEAGWVTVFELETLPGFVLNQDPVNVYLRPNRVATVELFNDPLPGLQIRKTCSVSHNPLASVLFQISRLNGSVIGTFETDELGIIYLDLDERYVVITELRTVSGYRLDAVPRTVQLAPGELKIVSYQNTPFPILEIVKLDRQNNQPLQHVRFKVFDRHMRELGTFTTNNLGRIILTGMDEGRYFVQEYCVANAGPFVLDRTVHEIMLHYGKTTAITVYNDRMGSLRLRKECSETGQPLPGATFLLYDERNNIMGEFTTNALGIIELENRFEPQRLRLREIRSPDGWVLDDKTSHEVTIRAGETTEIVLTNDPKRGQIQIVKRAAAWNDVTKDRAGAALAGAVCEVGNERLEVVDTITSDSRGIAVTRPLPMGRYAVREIESPDFYVLNDAVFYADIRLHGDVVRFEVLNQPADLHVTVEKRGNVEAIPGDLIRYDFSHISNASNVALDDFYWRDTLPADAVRLETLVTGTWNERLAYRVVYRTNLKPEFRTWRSDLLTTVNHELEVSELRLAANEFVTEFRLEFGTVQPGFREVSAPYIMTRVLDGLPHEHRFVNRTDAGGRIGDAIVYNLDSWVTVAFATPRGALPRTGL